MVLLEDGFSLCEQYQNIGDHLNMPSDITALLGKLAINDRERVLISLPVHLCGLGIVILSHLSTVQFNTSLQVTNPLVDLIVEQSSS